MSKFICVIDDDKIYQKIIHKLILRAEVFEGAVFYESAVEALKEFLSSKEELPSIILLDINMPVLDGWQFLEQMEAHFPDLYQNIRVYIVTSSIAYSDKERLKQFSGVSGFLSKPLNVEDVKQIGATA